MLAVATSLPAGAQSLEELLTAESSEKLAEDARRDGDPVRGAAIFYARNMACSVCHSMGNGQNTVGPDLATWKVKPTDAYLVESVLLPSRVVAKQYTTVVAVMTDGRVVMGISVEDSEERLVLRDASPPNRLVTLRKSEIDEYREITRSAMPTGQVNLLGERGHFLDLIRYLIEVRDGGAARARDLQPPPDPLAQKIPDDPLPWRPVVQRGEVDVPGDDRYPHAVALGFVGGTAIFDANRLRTVAAWNDGFVTSSPQNYFGLYWHADGTPVSALADCTEPLQFQFIDDQSWQTFEPAATSDPNTGTRFDGYQIGRNSVRLKYRVLVGRQRISVTEDLRMENYPQWQGIIREFHFSGIPVAGQVAFQLPSGSAYRFRNGAGEPLPTARNQAADAVLQYQSADAQLVARSQSGGNATWQSGEGTDNGLWRLVSRQATADQPVTLRIDLWKYRGSHPEPTVEDLRLLDESATSPDEAFDAPVVAAQPLPPVPDRPASRIESPSRPAVQPQENTDEFPAARGRFLRFVVTATLGDSEPGLDELEVYGPGGDVNLALNGKATASSVISGYSIHQIPHLNDGKLGNNHSWISAEPGGGWAQIEFPETVEMNRIVWARDRTGVCRDRLASKYRVEISDDGQRWVKVADEGGRAAPGGFVGAIQRDASPGYVMESIPGPFPTWRPSDVIFDDAGTMYAIAMTEGQIWRTRTPPADHPERVDWHRYAAGLYHPIGLALVDGHLYVAQKQEITELIDRDGDGVVEHFRTVATGWGLSTGWHEYCFGLAVDPEQNLWFALNTGYFWTNPGYVNPGRWRGSVMRIEHDSENLAVMATGCRVPNGIGQGPEGNIFFTDNQGDWIQSCKLAHVVPGRFYGHPETTEDALPQDSYPDGRSAIWLPYDRCRSVSGPVHDTTAGRFGPFADQMFVGDVGYGANPGIMRIALEQVNGEYQGACMRFVEGQPHGCQRMRFGPDHQLYQTSLASGLTRMAFTGQTPLAIHSVNIRARGQGFVVQLTEPLAVDTQLSTEQFRVKRYHYLYTGNYGSPQADEQIVPVQDVQLSADRSSITLTFPVESYPIGMVYEINLGALKSQAGDTLVHNEAWYTVNSIPE